LAFAWNNACAVADAMAKLDRGRRVVILKQLAKLVGPLAMAVMVGVSAQAKEWTHLRIATEGAFPPYNMVMPDGKLAGFEIDLAADLCRRMKVQCEVVAQDWDGILPGLNAGKYDAIIAAMAITPKRLEVIAFSIPYVSSPTVFATTKGSGIEALPGDGTRIDLSDDAAARAVIETMKAKLKGKVIGVQVSTIQSDFLNTYFKGTVEVRTYKTSDEFNLDLAAGRIDAVLAAAANIKAAMDTADGKDIVFTGPYFGGGPIGIGSGIGLRKADPELKQMFDGAIQAAAADGTLARLSTQWFKIDLTPR